MQAYTLPWDPYRVGPGALGAVPGVRSKQTVIASRRDPIFNFGQTGAKTILAGVKRHPGAQRKAVLKATLDTIDPSLFAAVAQKAQVLQAKGLSADQALQKALELITPEPIV